MSYRRILSIVCIMAVIAGIGWSPSTKSYAAMADSDFLKTNGTVIRDHSGTGDIVNLRGTNLASWMLQEDWISPLGEFALEREGWSVAASINVSAAANILDGKDTTRWTTNAAQTNGQWIQVNLGSRQTFNKIIVDAGPGSNDYAVKYKVEVSNNAVNWTEVASGAEPEGLEKFADIRFIPQTAQYIKITQTGSSSSKYWSVSELNVMSMPVTSKTGWVATASDTLAGTAALNAIDGNLSTRWSTGKAQSPGQWFQVDMGKTQQIGGLMIDTGAVNTADYFKYAEVLFSTDGVNWNSATEMKGTNNRLTNIYAGGAVRYFKIVLLANSSNSYWSIGEIAAFTSGDFNKTGWTATASSTANATSTSSMLDNDVTTRWSTGLAQASGQYVQVDMGNYHTFNQIILDSGASNPWDYAKDCKVEVSKDGSTWVQVATARGSSQKLPVNFQAVLARYIRVTQIGTSANSWWSIAELNVYLNSDDYSLRKNLNGKFGSSIAEGLLEDFKSYWIQETDLDSIQNMGMNVVRVPMMWLEFMNEDGSWKAEPWSKLDWLVGQCSSRGIYVILDLHGVPGGQSGGWSTGGQTGSNKLWTDAWYLDKTVELWKGIAAHYRDNPAIAGYDLINEPVNDVNPAVTNHSVYNTLYQAVRSVDPEHIIIVEAFFGWNDIVPPTTYGWSNIVYETHHYNGGANTYDWNTQNQFINTLLQDLSAHQSDWNVPVYVGEFNFWYHEDLWQKWLAGLNQLNISWTNWCYKLRIDGNHWGFYDTNYMPVPIINNDAADTIRAKWSRFVTSNLRTNSDLINLIKPYAAGEASTIDNGSVALDRGGWTVTASHQSAAATAAVDGNFGTSWTTGNLQTEGQWFQINMGERTMFDAINLDAGLSSKDYPNTFEVQVSNDGAYWTTVKSVKGYGYKMVISFSPQFAQYIRIVQTGSSLAHQWSIQELFVYSETELSRTDWNASASSVLSGTSANLVLDNDSLTRWSTGLAQSAGQYIQLDMQAARDINRILLTTGPYPTDYPREYEVRVSSDGSTWNTVAGGTCSTPDLIVSFPHQTARYLKVVQTGSSGSSYWSTAEFRVYGEEES